MKNFKHNGKYSQNGESGIIDEVIKRVQPTFNVAVEFGAPTKAYCSNIYHLEEKGWNCIFFDSDPQEEGIIKKFITKENVNELPECSIASFDTDGADYELWKAYKSEPILVIVEINSSVDPDKDFFSLKDGCNFSLMNKLADEKGYTLLCHTGNCLYIRNDLAHLFPEADKTFDTTWLQA
jgi:hypothetical protein